MLGPKSDLTYKYDHISDNLSHLNDILAGKSYFTDILQNAKKPMIIIGTSAINFEGGQDILRICSEIANKYKIINETFNGLNILQQNLSRVGSLDIKFYNNSFDQNWNSSIKKHIDTNKPVVFLLDLDDIDLSILENAYVVYIGHHGDIAASVADAVLPAPAFPERSSTYVNTEGRVVQTTKCMHPLGESKEEWKIFRALSNEFNDNLKFNNLGELRQDIIKEYSFLKELNVLQISEKINFGNSARIKDRKVRYNISNFYMTDSISRASSTMAICTKEILNMVA